MNSRLIRRLAMISIAAAVAASSPSQALADALDNWTTNVISATEYHLNRVIYQSGRYVGVGTETMFPDFGYTAISTNGVNWTAGTHGWDSGGNTIYELFGVAGNGSGFAAVGRFGYVYWSSDGLNWTQGGAGPDEFVDIAASPLMYVAISQTNVLRFPGRYSWNVTLGDDVLLSSIAYGAERFVVAGRDGYHTFTYVSTNWWDWNTCLVIVPGGSPTPMFSPSVCFGKTFFIMPWGPKENRISTDGIFWSSITNDSGAAFQKIRYGNGVYVGLTPEAIYTSPNGTNWIKRPPNGGALTDAAVGERNAIVTAYYWGAAANSYVSDPFVGLSIQSGAPPQLQLSGLNGRTYRLEYADTLEPGNSSNWQTLSNIVLNVSPLTLLDSVATNSPARFYRGVLLP